MGRSTSTTRTPSTRILIGAPDNPRYLALYQWADEHLHHFLPDFHRLQLERFVWNAIRRELETRADASRFFRVLDIGVYERRTWVTKP